VTGSLLQSGVAVAKLHFPQDGQNLGDRKCLEELRTSLVGLPNAKCFRPVSGERVFQQPQAITLKCPVQGQMSVMGMLRQQPNGQVPRFVAVMREATSYLLWRVGITGARSRLSLD